MNNITIELTEDDRARLDRLTAALERVAAAYEAVSTGTEPIDTPVATAQATAEQAPTTQTDAEPPSVTDTPSEAPAPENNTPEPEKPAESRTEPPTATQYTMADVRSRVTALLANPESKKAVRNIVTEYAPKVSEIPPEKYPEVIAKLDLLAMEG